MFEILEVSGPESYLTLDTWTTQSEALTATINHLKARTGTPARFHVLYVKESGQYPEDRYRIKLRFDTQKQRLQTSLEKWAPEHNCWTDPAKS